LISRNTFAIQVGAARTALGLSVYLSSRILDISTMLQEIIE